MILIAKIPSHDLKANAQIGVDGQLRKSNKMKSPFSPLFPALPYSPSLLHRARRGGKCQRRDVSPAGSVTASYCRPDT